MERTNENLIGAKFHNFTLILTNVRENYGHDDSLPFQAEWAVIDADGVVMCNGWAYNDGWGGPNMIDIKYEEYKGLTDSVEKHLIDAFTFTPRGYHFTIKGDLDFIVGILAEEYLSSRFNTRGIYEEHEFLHDLIVN